MTPTAMPGFETADRDALNGEARTLLTEALGSGRRASSLALVCTPEGCRVLGAQALADELAADGVGKLARRVRGALVPRESVLVVVLGDDCGIAVVPVATILGSDHAPGASVTGPAEPRRDTPDAAPRPSSVGAGATFL